MWGGFRSGVLRGSATHHSGRGARSIDGTRSPCRRRSYLLSGGFRRTQTAAHRRTRRCCLSAIPPSRRRAPWRIAPQSSWTASAHAWLRTSDATHATPCAPPPPCAALHASPRPAPRRAHPPRMSAQSCENERSAALRQKISSRVRAPAFAGATTGVRGGRNALGAPLEALQRPHATSYHLLTTFVPLTPTSEKGHPVCVPRSRPRLPRGANFSASYLDSVSTSRADLWRIGGVLGEFSTDTERTTT